MLSFYDSWKKSTGWDDGSVGAVEWEMVDFIGYKISTTSSAAKIVGVGCKKPTIGQTGSRQVGRLRNDWVELMHRILEIVLGRVTPCWSLWYWTDGRSSASRLGLIGGQCSQSTTHHHRATSRSTWSVSYTWVTGRRWSFMVELLFDQLMKSWYATSNIYVFFGHSSSLSLACSKR